MLQLSLECSYSIEHTRWKKVQAWVDILQISVSCQPKPWIAAFVHRNATKVYMLHNKNAQNSVADFLSWKYTVMFKKDREETKESALNCMMMSVFQISSQSLIHGNFFSHLHRLYQVFLSNHFFQDFIAKILRPLTIIPLLRVCFEICGCAIHMNEGYLLCFYSQFPLQEYYTRLDLIS